MGLRVAALQRPRREKRREGPGTHASAAQLVALHHGDPGAQLGRPASAGQPTRAAPDHQVVVGNHGAYGGQRALRLQLLPERHGADAGGQGLKQREAGEGARHPSPARPRARTQGPGQQGHARGSAQSGAAPRRSPGKEGVRAPGNRSLTVTKHPPGARREGAKGGDRALGRGSAGPGPAPSPFTCAEDAGSAQGEKF